MLAPDDFEELLSCIPTWKHVRTLNLERNHVSYRINPKKSFELGNRVANACQQCQSLVCIILSRNLKLKYMTVKALLEYVKQHGHLGNVRSIELDGNPNISTRAARALAIALQPEQPIQQRKRKGNQAKKDDGSNKTQRSKRRATKE